TPTPPPDTYTLSLHDALPIYRLTPIPKWPRYTTASRPGCNSLRRLTTLSKLRACPQATLCSTSVREPAWSQRQRGQQPDPKVSLDRKSTRLNSSHLGISYAVF